MAGNIDQWDRAGNHRRRSLIRHSALRHLRHLGLAQSMGDRIIPGTGRRADPPRKISAGALLSPPQQPEYPMTQAMSRVALYAAVGPELMHYEVDVAAGTLTRRGDVQLPANVQYPWPHVSGHLLYAGCSNAAAGRGIVGSDHSLIALAIDPASGALSPCGDPVALPTRPIHLTTDILRTRSRRTHQSQPRAGVPHEPGRQSRRTGPPGR
jgi:hypothetical protein